MGENGAGKSTLLKILNGDYQPDQGTMTMDGEALRFSSPREARQAGIRVIYQEPEIIPGVDVAENIYAGDLPKRGPFVDRGRLDRQVAADLRRYGFENLLPLSLMGDQLSAAQRQLVEIARALRSGARVLALDEPTSSLTDEEVERLFGLVRRLRDEGVAIIYVSHRINEILRLSNRVAVLRDGRLIAVRLAASLTEGEIVRLMVGRELTDVFGRQRAPAGKVILKVAGLTSIWHHLLHDRARYRVDPAGGEGRQGRRAGVALLHRHVDGRPDHRAARRQPPSAGCGPASPTPPGPRAQAAAGGEHQTTTEFLLGIIPTTLVSPLVGELVLQTLFVALLIGFAVQGLGQSGQAILRGVKHFERLVFRVLSMIMWVAPIGAFGAIAAVVGETGWSALVSLGQLMLAFYITCAIFIVVVLGAAPALRGRDEHLLADALPGQGVPADRLHVVLGSRAAPAGGQDGAPRRLPPGRRHHGSDRLLVQPRRHRHLPDHGVAVHRRSAGQAAVDRRADLAAAVHDDRVEGGGRRDRRRPGRPGRWAAVAPTRSGRRASA